MARLALLKPEIGGSGDPARSVLATSASTRRTGVAFHLSVRRFLTV
jgi:hypothetical protein